MDARARFLSAIRRADLAGKHILVAVSGGADSVALMRLLLSVREEAQLALSAAHMEHGIRGGESLADCAFVENLCARLNVPLTVCHADIPAESERTAEGLETCARRLRYAFLRRTRAEIHADVIAVAHHMNDQAETVLMHLLRGSGLRGASGMRLREGDIVRPLLDFTRPQIEAYLAEIGQDYRTDSTNLVSDNPRNALRNEVFPLLNACYPGAVTALGRFAALSRDEDAFLEAAADRQERESASFYADVCVLSAPDEIPACILRRLIRRALPMADFDDVERARTAQGRVQLAEGAEAWRIDDRLYLLPAFSAPEPVPIPAEGECVLRGICTLTAAPSAPVPVRNDPFTQVMNAEALTEACLRTRRDGDYIRPFGMNGQKKSLSDYLTDRKFPRPLRSRLPVIAVNDEILWAAGVGLSDTARISANTAARRLKINIK